MTKNTFDPQIKIQIVLEFFTTNISTAELCRKHNLSPQTFQTWKEKFLHGGKQALQTRGKKTTDTHVKEIDNLKKIIGELTIVNDALKKTLEGNKR